jgi:hypothetical protein
MSRLNQLRAELELLERLHTLQGQVSATETKPQSPKQISLSATHYANFWSNTTNWPKSRPLLLLVVSSLLGNNSPS